MNGYISYMDILAFSSKIRSKIKPNVFKTKYENLITYVGEKFQQDSKAKIYVVSDSIIAISQELRMVINYSRMIYTWGMLNDFWIRGGIAQGEIEIADSTTIVRGNKNIILPYLGDAYLTAYNLESELNTAGIVIDENIKSNNPDLPLEVEYVDGYMEYQEYLPKEGSDRKKQLIVPSKNDEIYIADRLHFREMLRSHADDIDKYVNTFCFYIKLLLPRSHKENVMNFLKRLIEQLKLHGRRFLIPQKVIIIFVAAIDALIERHNDPAQKYTKSLLKADIGRILDALKAQGYLSAFSDYLLEFDKKRKTKLYKEVHDILLGEGRR